MATARKLAGETRLGRSTAVALEEITAIAMTMIEEAMTAIKQARDKNDVVGIYAHARAIEKASRIKEISKLARVCEYDEDSQLTGKLPE